MAGCNLADMPPGCILPCPGCVCHKTRGADRQVRNNQCSDQCGGDRIGEEKAKRIYNILEQNKQYVNLWLSLLCWSGLLLGKHRLRGNWYVNSIAAFPL